MKDFLQPITELITKLVTPKSGSKFLISALAIGGIVYLAKTFAETPNLLTTSVLTIGLIAVIYFAADYFHKKHNKPNGGSDA